MKYIIVLIAIQVVVSTFLSIQNTISAPSLSSWNYIEGGDDWLEVKSWQCNGKMQSPVNIQIADAYQLPNCKLYSHVEIPGPISLEIVNTGHSLKIAGKGILLSMRVNGINGNALDYECGTMNMHGPSEHMIENNHFDMEMHFVCKEKNAETEFGVLTILFEGERNVENHFFEPFGAAAASLKYKGDKAAILMDFKNTFELEIGKLGELFYYNYHGSFTVNLIYLFHLFRLRPLHALRISYGLFQASQ